MLQGHYQQGRDQLAKLVAHSEIPVVALTAFAEVLVKEGQSDLARQQLKRAMLMAPDCPRVLSLLAQTYLCSGENYNSEYAIQLATSACQNSQWLSPREMHVLAEAHYHSGDKMSALLIASRAKQAGSKLLGAYRDNKSLERLIQDLSSGTLA
jgi:predicted Zn-dependent protease